MPVLNMVLPWSQKYLVLLCSSVSQKSGGAFTIEVAQAYS